MFTPTHPVRSGHSWVLALIAALGLAFAVPAVAAGDDASTYDKDSIIKDAAEFFGETTEGLAKVIEKAFNEQGRPNGYIKGEEIAGAVGVGLRYGDGTLTLKKGGSAKVYWQGPSIGFDVGANASKVFILVYNLPRTQDIYQRFPGIDGSVYYVAGAGINYQQRDNIVLAPIRVGVGLRTGASVGYMHYTPTKTLNPL
ncbi:DUF1134 domain-containing protein [Azoarcus olearius]|uniref:Conserved hypothetical secreted protein n=1 Tax=Azoarcus sp. (strain BH72) TaxID=418699 RepID=A1K1F5_AZOSB|nr:DUF1134 domain-containing protein [Azoarcus olearius]ANQ83135.1 hypothetical protein dqs_0052 [Azoarcus olearius]CAL92660.1 conserved hypothetical secreted protein [Azoarcus olearius]